MWSRSQWVNGSYMHNDAYCVKTKQKTIKVYLSQEEKNVMEFKRVLFKNHRNRSPSGIEIE